MTNIEMRKEDSDKFLNEEIAKNENVLVLYFYSPFVGPCKIFEPRFQEFQDMFPDVSFTSLNIENGFSGTIDALKIRSIPAVVVYKGNKPIQKFIGNQRCELVPELIRELLASE